MNLNFTCLDVRIHLALTLLPPLGPEPLLVSWHWDMGV